MAVAVEWLAKDPWWLGGRGCERKNVLLFGNILHTQPIFQPVQGVRLVCSFQLCPFHSSYEEGKSAGVSTC